jgi:hypothetical protein
MTGYDPAGYYDHGCRACGHTDEVHIADADCTGVIGVPGHIAKTAPCNCPGWVEQPGPTKPLNPMRITADGLVYTPTVLSIGDYVQMGDNHFIVAQEGAAWRLTPMPAPEPPEPPFHETLAAVWVDTGVGSGRALGHSAAVAAIDAVSKRLDDVDALAEAIRQADDGYEKGAEELAEHLVHWMLERLL